MNNEGLFAGRDYELDRSLLTVEGIVGEGQFGDVHRGTYRAKDQVTDVAIKTCKVEAEPEFAEKFLEEARTL